MPQNEQIARRFNQFYPLKNERRLRLKRCASDVKRLLLKLFPPKRLRQPRLIRLKQRRNLLSPFQQVLVKQQHNLAPHKVELLLKRRKKRAQFDLAVNGNGERRPPRNKSVKKVRKLRGKQRPRRAKIRKRIGTKKNAHFKQFVRQHKPKMPLKNAKKERHKPLRRQYARVARRQVKLLRPPLQQVFRRQHPLLLLRRTFRRVVQKVGLLAQLQIHQPPKQVVVMQPKNVGTNPLPLREKNGRTIQRLREQKSVGFERLSNRLPP